MHSLAEIRARTYQSLDAWWTVLLVDPVASRLLRHAAGRRWITPNRLTALAALLGLGAAASFLGQSRGWLILGALLFHLGFVADCMDGRLARLTGAGTLFDAWFDFMVARLRAVLCAAALMGGQYARTGQARYLWLAVVVVAVDLLRYLDAAQLARVRAALAAPATVASARPGRLGLVKAALGRRRIRVHLVSGIEFEMFVFIVGPVTGWITGVTVTAGVLLAVFEVRLVVMMWRATRRPVAYRVPQMVPAGLPVTAAAGVGSARDE